MEVVARLDPRAFRFCVERIEIVERHAIVEDRGRDVAQDVQPAARRLLRDGLDFDVFAGQRLGERGQGPPERRLRALPEMRPRQIEHATLARRLCEAAVGLRALDEEGLAYEEAQDTFCFARPVDQHSHDPIVGGKTSRVNVKRHLALDEGACLHVVHVVAGGEQTRSASDRRFEIGKTVARDTDGLRGASHVFLTFARALVDHEPHPMPVPDPAGLTVDGQKRLRLLRAIVGRERMNEPTVARAGRTRAIDADHDLVDLPRQIAAPPVGVGVEDEPDAARHAPERLQRIDVGRRREAPLVRNARRHQPREDAGGHDRLVPARHGEPERAPQRHGCGNLSIARVLERTRDQQRRQRAAAANGHAMARAAGGGVGLQREQGDRRTGARQGLHTAAPNEMVEVAFERVGARRIDEQLRDGHIVARKVLEVLLEARTVAIEDKGGRERREGGVEFLWRRWSAKPALPRVLFVIRLRAAGHRQQADQEFACCSIEIGPSPGRGYNGIVREVRSDCRRTDRTAAAVRAQDRNPSIA